MSQRLRKIVSESREAFSEVHRLSQVVSGLRVDERKLKSLENHIDGLLRKEKYSIKLSRATEKQIEQIRKQLVVFEDVQFVDLKKAKAPHEVIQAFGRGIDRAMGIIEESLVALGNNVREIEGDVDEDLHGLIVALEEVEKEKEKLEKWEEYKDIEKIEHIFVKHKVKDYVKALEPLRKSIDSLRKLAEEFSVVEKDIKASVKGIRDMKLKDQLNLANKIRSDAHKVLDHLMKLAYNESMRYRKAHIKILKELRDLYNAIVSMEIRTGLKDVLKRRTPSAKKAIPGKPRLTP